MVKTKINKKPKPNNNNKQQHNGKKNGNKSDISEFRAQLDALGLKIIEVTADGNCFFRFVYMLLSNLLNTKLLKVSRMAQKFLKRLPQNASESNGGLDENVLKSEVELLGASGERLGSDGEDSEKDLYPI
ncbi:Ovarian tumor, otubain [Artemisia annua]|uniref:Ovarian tumor, otubain n=1 Tax=Artemisia annua TaxID=35608 RepID=A0A2U1P1K6_ARTAN|nr:Ovarian tumor, otubain [Artemisia annua]